MRPDLVNFRHFGQILKLWYVLLVLKYLENVKYLGKFYLRLLLTLQFLQLAKYLKKYKPSGHTFVRGKRHNIYGILFGHFAADKSVAKSLRRFYHFNFVSKILLISASFGTFDVTTFFSKGYNKKWRCRTIVVAQ